MKNMWNMRNECDQLAIFPFLSCIYIPSPKYTDKAEYATTTTAQILWILHNTSLKALDIVLQVGGWRVRKCLYSLYAPRLLWPGHRVHSCRNWEVWRPVVTFSLISQTGLLKEVFRSRPNGIKISQSQHSHESWRCSHISVQPSS